MSAVRLYGRAFLGETIEPDTLVTIHDGVLRTGPDGVSFSRSIPWRNAASVLPEPVGACTSTCAPVAIAGQASSWAGVGLPNARSNHDLVAGESESSAATVQP